MTLPIFLYFVHSYFVLNKIRAAPYKDSPHLFYLHILLIFNSTYTYTVPVRFGKHVTYSLTFGSDTCRINLIFVDQDRFTASARAAAIRALTSTLPSGEAYPLITTFESAYFFI